MARYAIPSDKAFGVTVGALRAYAKTLGRDHALAAALWDTGWYEARMLAAFVGDPEQLTTVQMDRWCREFDSWAICDTVCFHLFDRTELAFGRIGPWAAKKEEFVRRGAFALLASRALHDRKSEDPAFARCLPLIERAARDERNFVKKGVSWALRLVGRRSVALNAKAVELSRHLADSDHPAERWIGKDALRELTSPAVKVRLAARARKAATGKR
jgi:3-methyladenine DNA glycosylase AlkD